MVEQEAKQRRPFHESVVDAIRRASYTDLICLGMLLKETKIPNGHDEIISEWDLREGDLNVFVPLLGVTTSLLEQKREAEEKEKAKEQKEIVTS